MSRITDENKEVFRRGRYFSEPAAATGKIIPASDGREAVFKSKAKIRETAKKEDRRVKLDMVEQDDEMPTVVFEEIGQEEEQAEKNYGSIQDISDELERLSFRYGRGMEEWLA